jgi:hypothetical protein
MELFKQRATLEEEDKERYEEEEDEFPIDGQALRRRMSSWVPPLPGLERKQTVHVHTSQVTMLSIMFTICILVGLREPLLELHISYMGLTFHRKLLTFQEVLDDLLIYENGTGMSFMIKLFVIYIPFIYVIVLIFAGVISARFWTSHFGIHLPESAGAQANRDAGWYMKRAFEGSVWFTSLLRPWVFTDVYAISISLFLWSCQADFMATTIPSGYIFFPSDSGGKQVNISMLGGMYMVIGAGVSIFFLRWFWEKQWEESDADGFDDDAGNPGLDYGPAVTKFDHMHSERQKQKKTKFVYPKKMSCAIIWWVVFCIAVNNMPMTIKRFELKNTNKVLGNVTKMMHKYIHKKVPNSYGHCIPGAPEPCTEGGVLYHAQLDTKRISVLYVAGLNTLNVSTIEVNRVASTPDLAMATTALATTTEKPDTMMMGDDELGGRSSSGSDDEQSDRSSSRRHSNHSDRRLGKPPANLTKLSTQYVLQVKGELKQLSIELRVELCADKHGNGCKVLLQNNNSCCEPHREFNIEISMTCSNANPVLHVSGFHLGSLVVRPQLDATSLAGVQESGSQVLVNLPVQDITGQVRDTIKSQLVDYLTNKTLVKWGGKPMNFQQLLARVLRFSIKDDIFQC